MPQVLEDSHKQDHIEFPIDGCEVIGGHRAKINIEFKSTGCKSCLIDRLGLLFKIDAENIRGTEFL